MVIGRSPAVPVENAAARRQDGHRLDTVLLGAHAVELRVLYLQPPEARNQEQKDAHGGVLENGDLPGREPGVVMAAAACRRPAFRDFGSAGAESQGSVGAGHARPLLNLSGFRAVYEAVVPETCFDKMARVQKV